MRSRRSGAIAEVRFDNEPGELSLPALVGAARGCDALIAYRQNRALETVAQLRQLLAGEMPAGAVNREHAERWRRRCRAGFDAGAAMSAGRT